MCSAGYERPLSVRGMQQFSVEVGIIISSKDSYFAANEMRLTRA